MARSEFIKSRPTARISQELESKLVTYITAASAAGVGLLGGATSAQARVVYTATNTTVIYGSPVPIDLNHDGITDLTINLMGGFFHSELLMAKPATGNGALVANGGAAAGFFGVPVGPGEKFASNIFYSYGLVMADAGMYGGSSWFDGQWANASNRYLGLKFVINGQTHFGWVRMSVGNFLKGGQILLTGYAYETTPNTNIIEGHLSGPGADSRFTAENTLTPGTRPASLGILARGADTLAIWRREEDSAAI